MVEVQLVRLITGEELIGKVKFLTINNTVSIEKPARIIVQPPKTQNDSPSLGFMPWPAFVSEKAMKDGIILNRDHVLYTAEPDTEIFNAYNQMFGSGLVKPPGTPKLIVT